MKNALLSLVLVGLAAPAAACEMLEYKRVKASAHVHVFEAAEGTTAVVNGNVVAVVGKDAILVVDTGQLLGNARRIIEDIRRISPAPVRYIVNTHWHGDHILANSVFKEAFPEARILAHSFTIAEGAKRYDDYAAKTMRSLPIYLEQSRKRAEASTSGDEKLWIAKTSACVEKVLPDVERTRYLGAEQAVDTELTLDLGGVSVLVKHLGTGNTPGDLVAWVEADRLIATGDMVVAPVPYAIGSASLDTWTRTLAAVRAFRPEVIVPGHGPVLRDDAYVRDVEALLESTRKQLAALHAQGLDKADAETRLDVSPFRERYIDTPMRRQAFLQFFVRAAITQAWAKP